MKHYLTDKNGMDHVVEEYGWTEGKVTLCVDNCKIVTLKMYYREPKTLDDYMGNTPCGYYAIVPIRKNEHRRVYLYLNK